MKFDDPEDKRSQETNETVSSPRPRLLGLEIGGNFGPRYKILEKLGQGGMGTVYRAYDNELNREIALKLIRPALSEEQIIIDRFKREILLAGRITHKNVLRIHDLGEVDGILYVSMNLVRGDDLGKILKREGSFTPARATRVLEQICLGLKAAHDEGIIHRDLKPQNILVDEHDNVFITDFGLASSMDGAMEPLTTTGHMPGTPLYMSPEQINADKLGKPSDLYTVGLILYEMLTDSFPFEKSSGFKALYKRTVQRPVTPRKIKPEIPEFMAAIVLKCLEPGLQHRYGDAAEILEDLKRKDAPALHRSAGT